MQKPAATNQSSFDLVVKEISKTVLNLFNELETRSPYRIREVEREKALDRKMVSPKYCD